MLDPRVLVFEPATSRQQRWFYFAVAAVAGVLWIVHAQLPLVFPVDDAYVTLHNAQVVVSGTDVNYGVSALLGATSPFHVLLTALLAFVMPAATALYVVMWLGAIAYALGVARLAFVHKASIAETALIVVVAVIVAEVPHQLMNGLETGWAMAGLVWTLALASDTLARARITAALCGLLPLLRPELAVVSVLVFALQATRRWHAEPKRAALRAIAIDASIAIVVVLPFAIAVWVATGSPLPGTVSAKRQFFAEGCANIAFKHDWLIDNVEAFAGLLGALCAGVALLAVTRLGRAGLLFIVTLLFAYYRELPGALGHYEHRYMYPILPVVLFGVVSCIRHPKRLIRFAALAILALTALTSTLAAPAAWRRHRVHVQFTVDELATVADWARDHIPPGSRVLVHDAGYIAYATELPLIDLVGLKTPTSADAHARWTWPTCGRLRGEAVHQIASARHAEYLIVLKSWDGIFHFVRALADHGWRVEKLRTVAADGYEVYKLTPPVSKS